MEMLQPPGWPRAKGYSNGIAAKGTMVFTAGLVGWNEKARSGGPGGLIRGPVLPTRSVVSGLGNLVIETVELDGAGDDGGVDGLAVHRRLWGGTPSEDDAGGSTSDTKARCRQSEMRIEGPARRCRRVRRKSAQMLALSGYLLLPPPPPP